MFLHLSVILFTGGGMHGEGWRHAWQRGGACMLQGGVCGEGAYMAGGGMRAGERATEAGGTHPTGMHSC